MLNYNNQRCIRCNEYFKPDNSKRVLCYNCSPKPMRNNKNGYNKHKKNPKPKKVKVELPPTREELGQAYKELWEAKCVMLSKAQVYSRKLNQFIGIDLKAIEKDVIERYQKDLKNVKELERKYK